MKVYTLVALLAGATHAKHHHRRHHRPHSQAGVQLYSDSRQETNSRKNLLMVNQWDPKVLSVMDADSYTEAVKDTMDEFKE